MERTQSSGLTTLFFRLDVAVCDKIVYKKYQTVIGNEKNKIKNRWYVGRSSGAVDCFYQITFSVPSKRAYRNYTYRTNCNFSSKKNRADIKKTRRRNRVKTRFRRRRYRYTLSFIILLVGVQRRPCRLNRSEVVPVVVTYGGRVRAVRGIYRKRNLSTFKPRTTTIRVYAKMPLSLRHCFRG